MYQTRFICPDTRFDAFLHRSLINSKLKTMESDSYFNFYENQRLGINFRVHSGLKTVTRHHVRKKLYKDMIRKDHYLPGIYDERSFGKTSSELTEHGGIFNIDFSPDS